MLTSGSAELTSGHHITLVIKVTWQEYQIPGALSSLHLWQSRTLSAPVSVLHVSYLQLGRVPKAWGERSLHFSHCFLCSIIY